MIKFSIQYDDLKYIFSALKSAIGSTWGRPEHQYIRFQCESGLLVAQSLDGYRIHSVSVPVTVEDGDCFEFLLKPFVLPKFKNILPVKCELSDKEIQFDFLDRKYIEKLGDGVKRWMDTKSAIPTAAPVFKIAFNSEYMADAAKSLSARSNQNGSVVMEFYGPMQPAKLYNRKNKDDYRLVLPVRIKEDINA